MNVKIVEHPLIEQALTVLRDKSTGTAAFRQQAGIVSTILVLDATAGLATESCEVETPLAKMQCKKLSGRTVVVPVLRAGLAMLFSAQDLLLDVPVGFLGLERDESTAIAREYYQKFPGDLAGCRALVLDPMLATGGSLDDTIVALKARNCCDITLVCVVAAPEGIERIAEKHDGVGLIVGAIDNCLDENKYIVPGLGDFGDRYFGT